MIDDDLKQIDMKVQDFERAIIEMNCSIVLDEVKIHKGHVRRFYGHKDCLLIMWDESGRGYSTMLNTVEKTEVRHDTHKGVAESCYDRDVVYDLKF